MRGARSIYVDYVDYDEIAHHAGSTRIESLAALTGLDQVLAVLEKVADGAPRRYHFVMLSDHGQSQGQPFAERWGTDLSDLCAELTRAETTGIESSVEGWGRVDSVVEDLAGGDRGSGVQRAASRRAGPQAGARRGGGRRRADRPGERQPRPGLRAGARAPDPGRDRSPVASARARTGGSPGHRLRGRPGRGRSGRDRTVRAAPSRHRSDRGHRPARGLGCARAGHADGRRVDGASTRPLRQQRRRSRPPSTWRRSNRWSAVTAASVAGRTGASSWPRPTCWRPSEPIMGGDDLHRHLIGILRSLGHRTEPARSTP